MSKSPSKKVIIVTGPTASGKTAIAIQLAKHFHTEIISADSRQCCKELNIGVARPSPEELQQVKHHFIATHSIQQEVTAATFEQYALEKITALFEKHDVVLMTGGTGLYIKAFCEGLHKVPEIDPSIRQQIIRNYSAKGMDWLQKEIRQKDPAFYKQGEIQNPQRSMRALEVVAATGRSILSFRKGNRIPRPFKIVKIGMDLPKEELQQNIDARADAMMEKGLLAEVRSLMPYRELNALQTVGYAEIFDHLDEKLSLEEAVAQIKIHTRQYAKRQLTWFRKDKNIKWFGPDNIKEMINVGF